MFFRFPLLAILITLYTPSFSQSAKTKLLIVGSDHLAQIYREGNPNTDVLTPKRQQELAAFRARLQQFRPDMIMVESLPENQPRLDSLYALYTKGRAEAGSWPDGRSEIYQIAFPMARASKLPGVYAVNAPGGTSQSILDNGKNIELYKKEMAELRTVVGAKYAAIQSGQLALNDYLVFMNQPETYNKVYHLRYIVPARVTDGTFKNPDAMVDTAFVNPRYIGSELIAIFKNRDYKIYSNIVTTRDRLKPQRIMLLIGGAHIGSLKNIFRDDDEYELVDATTLLKP